MTPPAGKGNPGTEIEQAEPGPTGRLLARWGKRLTVSGSWPAFRLASRPHGPKGPVVIRSTDSKGRFSLGSEFAHMTFIVTQGSDETEFILTASSVIPLRELWLHQNPEALASVKRGIEQASKGQFSESPPDLDADQALADED